jgi:hypothetical protein
MDLVLLNVASSVPTNRAPLNVKSTRKLKATEPIEVANPGQRFSLKS